MTEIRKLYSSKSGKYVGFKALNDQVAEKLNIYYMVEPSVICSSYNINESTTNPYMFCY